MKIRCKCGQTEMNFLHLKEKDFPNGFEGHCCPSAKSSVSLARKEPLKTTITEWLSRERLWDQDRSGEWVSATTAYSNYSESMRRVGQEADIVSATRFGLELKQHTRKIRKTAGIHYLLGRAL